MDLSQNQNLSEQSKILLETFEHLKLSRSKVMEEAKGLRNKIFKKNDQTSKIQSELDYEELKLKI